MTNSLLLKMAIEFVDLPIKHGDFPVCYVSLPEGQFHSFGTSRGSPQEAFNVRPMRSRRPVLKDQRPRAKAKVHLRNQVEKWAFESPHFWELVN